MKELLKNNWIEKGVIGLLVVLNTLFLYYWIVLAANYCFHFDDAHFMWKMREYSIFEYVKEMYMTRGGNFVSYGLNGIIFTISNWIGAYRFWAILFYVLGIIMTWGAFCDLPFIKNSGYKGWLGVITLYNVYVLTSIDYAVFTWMCAMEYYLFAPAICLLVKYISKETLNWKQLILLVGLAIFISGNAVSISTVSFVVLFLLGMWMWRKEGWNIRNTWHKPQVRKLIAITILMLLIFAVVYIAPGNWVRIGEENAGIAQPQNLMQFFKAIVVCCSMFLYMMAFYLPYHIIAVAMGAWAGIMHPMELPACRWKTILIIVVIAFVYLLVSVVPLAYLSNGFELQRNYTHICFFYILTFFVIGYIWTSGLKQTPRSCRLVNASLYVSILFLIVVMCLNIHIDLPVARAYDKAHNDRIAYLLDLQASGQTETVIVEPYPSVHTPDSKYVFFKILGKKTYMPAIYYESDVDVTPNGYESHLRRLYNLDFDFVLAEPKN